jgi:hypothetical protein
VEKKDLLEAQTAGLPLSGSECSSSAGVGSGLYRRGCKGGRVSPPENSRSAGPQSCDHQMEWVHMPSWLTNWKFLQFCKQGNKQEGFASSHKSGGLVLVLTLGPSTHPKNARDLTLGCNH